ncbi:glycosyltransferase [Rathayibacter soli]|uniref:glycosyltransferase n=1 Tax=Rathayibacter soli TaxID=3144168 RepID=UPI0027E48E18|nr:glycosyltransferase [Glaciibacter superstes]
MTDLVVISLEAWDGVWRRNQHLISRLLTGDPELRVLFIEPSADPLHELRSGRRAALGRSVRERGDVQPRLWTLRPLKLLPRKIDRGADRRFARAVQRAASSLGMTDPVLWVNDPGAAEVSRVTGWPTLYDITDDWAVADRPDRIRRRVVGGEQYLLHHATQVVACSAELVRRKTPDRPAELAPIVLVPNGVDVELYRRPAARPADLPAGKVAVYVGTLHGDRLDVELCVRTARALAGDATIVLVGPDALGESDTRRLREAGAVLLGAKPHEQVPAYLQHADVLLVPHLVSDFTESLDPIKLYEYQAVGRPVVSSPVAGFRDAAGEGIVIVGAAKFAHAVSTSLHSPVPCRSRGPEAVADWSTRAGAIGGVLKRIGHE